LFFSALYPRPIGRGFTAHFAKLVEHNIITLDGERKDTRGIFHKIYQDNGLDVPQSIDLYSKK
jgi:hypothetical protein